MSNSSKATICKYSDFKITITAFAMTLLTSCAQAAPQVSSPLSITSIQELQSETTLLDAQKGTSRNIPNFLHSRMHAHGFHAAWMKFGGDPAPEDGFIYVAQFYTSSINEYKANDQNNQPPVCSIHGPIAAQGMKTDSTGDLFATAFLSVVTFRKDCGAAEVLYSDRNNIADDVAIDGTKLYVSGLGDGINPTTINVYTLGNPYVTYQLSAPSFVKGIGLATDSHHNLFWSGASKNFNNGFVVEFPLGRGTNSGIVLNATKIGSDFPGGIIIDGSNNLLLIDQNNNSMNIYAPPYESRPFSTIALKGTTISCAMGIHQKRLYCLDYEYGSVDIYTYPQGTYIRSFTNGINTLDGPDGIAVQAP